jgi:hypothetical protein
MVKQEGTARYFGIRRKHREFLPIVLRRKSVRRPHRTCLLRRCLTPSPTRDSTTGYEKVKNPYYETYVFTDGSRNTDRLLAPRCRRAPNILCHRDEEKRKDGRSFVCHKSQDIFGMIHMVFLYDMYIYRYLVCMVPITLHTVPGRYVIQYAISDGLSSLR